MSCTNEIRCSSPQLSTEFDRNALLTLENYGGYNNRFFLAVFRLADFFPAAFRPNIQRVTNIEALGITITSQLSMNLHVDTLVESCGKTLYCLFTANTRHE